MTEIWKTTAPWTTGQVAALNKWQRAGNVHPFTCPGDLPGCEDHRDLIATPAGWVCACGQYRQDWAHGFMVSPEGFNGSPENATADAEAGRDMAKLSTAERLARAVLMFFDSGEWTADRREQWLAVTGRDECVSRVLGDLARQVRAEEEAKDSEPQEMLTRFGKDRALRGLAQRRELYRNAKLPDNASLPAGAPMFYRCIGCGATITMHEGWTSKPDCCAECEALRKLGWLE